MIYSCSFPFTIIFIESTEEHYFTVYCQQNNLFTVYAMVKSKFTWVLY